MGAVGSAAAQAGILLRPFVDSSALTGNAAALAARAREEGYLYFRGLIESSLILNLRRVALELAQSHGWLADGTPLIDGIAKSGLRMGAYDDKRWIAFLCDLLPCPEFRELGLHPSIVQVLKAVCGGPVLPNLGDLCRIVSPDTSAFTTVAHQDANYIGKAGNLWTVWIPLGACPLEDGPLVVQAGSHRNGLLPHEGGGAHRQGVALPAGTVWDGAGMECGDVLMFSGLCVHRALDNLSPDRLRLSVEYRYSAGS